MSEKRSVFLSYSHRDKALVDNLRHALDQAGVNYWADQDIRAGELWMDVMESAMKQASVFILMISPDFLASDWSMLEIGLALGKARESGAFILPVLLKDSLLPPVLSSFGWIDAREADSKHVVTQIMAAIESADRHAGLTRNRPSPGFPQPPTQGQQVPPFAEAVDLGSAESSAPTLVVATGEVPDQFKQLVRRARKLLLQSGSPTLLAALNAFITRLNDGGSESELEEIGDYLAEVYDNTRGGLLPHEPRS